MLGDFEFSIARHRVLRACGPAGKFLGLALITGLVVVMTAPGWAMAPPARPAVAAAVEPVGGASAGALLRQGKAAYEAGQLVAATEQWRQAAEVYGAQNRELDQALSLSYLSLSYQSLGDFQQAEQAIRQSLTILEGLELSEAGTVRVMAQAMNTYGSLQLAMGEPEAALDTWQQATDYYAQAGDAQGQLGSEINQAQAMQTLGLYRRAKTTLETINQRVQTQPDTSIKAAALRSLGSVLQVIGDLQLSQDLLEQSVAITEALNQPAETGSTLMMLANTLRIAQQPTAAIQTYESAIALLTAAPLEQLEAQLNLLSLLVDTQQWAAAQPLITDLQAQLSTLQPSRSAIYSRVNFAESVQKFNQTYSGAKPVSQEALAQLLATGVQQAKALQDQRAESQALGQLGQLYMQTQQWSEAQKLTQQALQLAKESDAKDITYRWQWQLGRILKQRSQKPQAIAAYTDAVDSLKAVRRDLLATNSEVQFGFKEKVEPIYRELVSLLLASETVSQNDLKEARNLIEDLQLAEMENYFRSACIDAETAAIDQIDPEAAVIYPIILPDRLEVVLSIPNQPLRHYQTPVDQATIEETVEEFFVYFNPALSDQKRLEISEEIYSWLIQPAAADLQANQIKTLVFVLDGALRNIPMAALYDGEHYLIETYGVALTPGLQLLGPHFSKPKPLQALMLGVSEARQGFAALPGVRQEIQAVAENIHQAEVYLDQAFTRQTLESEVQDTPFPIVHLATHGQFSSNLEETFVLAWDQKVGLTELDDLLRERRLQTFTPIELLVLSACQTAEGDDRATLGLAGMAIKSGARSTLATLWSVNDQSTVELMTKFYAVIGQADGTTKAEALRQAQLLLLQDDQHSHPFYWAPFVLIGNWLV
jgi:CHAT domain-containing protein